LRAMSRPARALRSTVQDAWLGINRRARARYRKTVASHPRLAARLRRLLWPVLRLGNRHLLGKDYLPPASFAPTAGSGPLQHLLYQQPRPDAPFAPTVTVIVPNYNHAPFLRQRLDSIYGQTWPHLDVILMDDASTDDSRAILQDYAARHPGRTRLILNDTNSGGVFHQWEKGLAAATGDLVWIAESDDWCRPDFLETIVPFFQNSGVMLAYARTDFMDATGQTRVWTMEDHLADLGPARWQKPWIETAPRIVRAGFGLKNIIPNASSAVFRRVDRLDLLGIDRWGGMRTCGDWMFYLNLIRGGLVAYSPDTVNYYRMHRANTSVTSYAEDSYYREHEAAAIETMRLYRVDSALFDRQRANLILHWKQNRNDFDASRFDSLYSLPRIRAAGADRPPALLMVGYAFSVGGGETFPIQLANQMKTAGYAVTYLDCAQEPEVPGIRAMLARDIPLLSGLDGLARIVTDFDIDIVHSHHTWIDIAVLDALPPDSPVRTVVTLHGMYETLPQTDLRRLLPRLVAQTGKLIYTAEKNLGALRALDLIGPGRASPERIDNALDQTCPPPLDRATLDIPADAFLLTLVSRALDDKGWIEAIAAVEQARADTGRDIRLVLIGTGPVHDRLLRTGHPDFVRLEGYRTNIRAYFAASDLGFMPTRSPGESFPLVVIDCLTAGRPVLASSIGEIPAMLGTFEGPAGLLFDLGPDWTIPVPTLAALIATAATDLALMDQLSARVPLAAARFDPAQMRDRYDAAYRSLLTTPGMTDAT